jgi:hypothetical protein
MIGLQNIGVGGVHDLGGISLDVRSIDQRHRDLAHWEKSIHALLVILASKTPKMITTDELRRGIEGLDKKTYSEWVSKLIVFDR